MKLEENDFILDIPTNFFKEIDRKKKILDSKRSLPKETVDSLMENYILNWTYNSIAIKGNTLTLMETKLVLEAITIGGKSMKEHLETVNHKDAITFLEDRVKSKNSLSEKDIRDIHRLLLKGFDNDNARRYRTNNVIISGATHIPLNSVLLNEKMKKLKIRIQLCLSNLSINT